MSIKKSEFQLAIKTTADLAAMDATIAKLRGQVEATQALGKDTAALEAQLEKAQSTRIYQKPKVESRGDWL